MLFTKGKSFLKASRIGCIIFRSTSVPYDSLPSSFLAWSRRAAKSDWAAFNPSGAINTKVIVSLKIKPVNFIASRLLRRKFWQVRHLLLTDARHGCRGMGKQYLSAITIGLMRQGFDDLEKNIGEQKTFQKV